MRSLPAHRVSRLSLFALIALALLAAPAALARPDRPGAQTFPGAPGAIAFVSTRSGNQEIWRMDIDGHGATQLSHAGNTNIQPAWSASGTQLAFTSDRDGNLEIYRMTATGTGVTRLTNNDAEDQEPAWFPGDDRIIFGGLRGSNYDLFTQDVDANGNPVGQPVQLTTSTANDIEPSVSPNGNLIAFASNRVTPQNPQGDFEIFVMKADAPEGPNNKPQQLTKNDNDDQYPDWSPDGTQIAFASDRNDPGVSFQIFTMTKQGKQELPLTAAGQNAIDPTWSPDGARLAYSAGDNTMSDVFRINANGRHQTNLTEESGFSFDPTWQPR